MASAASATHTVLILGSSGSVGCNTVKALSKEFPHVKIISGVRDPEGCRLDEKQFNNVTMVHADMSKPETLYAAIPRNVECVFINTPGDANRTHYTINAIDACKTAKAKHVVVVSVMCIGRSGLAFAEQFKPIEEHIKKSGLNYTILELPMFMDNIWMEMNSIRDEGKLYGPLRPDVKFNSIAVCDVGVAAAHIMAAPDKFVNKCYRLTAPLCTKLDKCRVLTNVLGRPVDYVQVSWDKARDCLMKNGLPAWQTNAIMELLKDIESGESYCTTVTSDFKSITGRDPMSFDRWCQNFAICFKEGFTPLDSAGWHRLVEWETQRGKMAAAGASSTVMGGYAAMPAGGCPTGMTPGMAPGMGPGMTQGMTQGMCQEHLKGCPTGSPCATRRLATGQSSRSDQPSF